MGQKTQLDMDNRHSNFVHNNNDDDDIIIIIIIIINSHLRGAFSINVHKRFTVCVVK